MNHKSNKNNTSLRHKNKKSNGNIANNSRKKNSNSNNQQESFTNITKNITLILQINNNKINSNNRDNKITANITVHIYNTYMIHI